MSRSQSRSRKPHNRSSPRRAPFPLNVRDPFFFELHVLPPVPASSSQPRPRWRALIFLAGPSPATAAYLRRVLIDSSHRHPPTFDDALAQSALSPEYGFNGH